MVKLLALCSVLVAIAAPASVVAHGDVPESDVACTGAALLNDDLAPHAVAGAGPAGVTAHHLVSARAEIVDASGSPVGTFYLDDRGDRYVSLEAGDGAAVVADLIGSSVTRETGEGGVPVALPAAFRLSEAYRLAACR